MLHHVAALWAFAPISVADVLAMPVIAAAIVSTAGYCGWVALSSRSQRSIQFSTSYNDPKI